VDPLLRLKFLLALATNESTHEEEARTAAMLAAKLIVSKGLVVSLPRSDDVETAFLDSILGRSRSAPPPAPPPRRAAVEDSDDLRSRRVRTRFAHRCRRCGTMVGVGDVGWLQNGVVNCDDCGPEMPTRS